MIQAITYVFNLIKVGKKYAFNYLRILILKILVAIYVFIPVYNTPINTLFWEQDLNVRKLILKNQ